MSIDKIDLDEIKPGEKCKIVEVFLEGAEGQRLLDMGFIKNTEVEIIRNAPFSDPVEVRIRGYNVNLRHSEAKKLKVVRI